MTRTKELKSSEANTMRTVFALSATSLVASIIPIVSVRTARNWEGITFRIATVQYVESLEETTTRTVFVPSVTRGDSDQLPRTQERCVSSTGSASSRTRRII